MRPLFTRLATVSPFSGIFSTVSMSSSGETVASRAGVLCQARCQIAATSLGEDLGPRLRTRLGLRKY